MKINLPKNDFAPVAEGEQVLQIVECNALPSGAPQTIELKMKDVNGRTITSTHNINNDKAMFVFSLYVRALLGDMEDFDTSDCAKLVGQFVTVEVKHVVKDSIKNEGQTVTFANVAKVIGAANPWVTNDTSDL